jgi:hypothetical protein
MNRRNFLMTLIGGIGAALIPLPNPPLKPSPYYTIQLSDCKARRFYIVDMAQIKAKEAIQAEEDANIFKAINDAIGKKI